MPYYLAATNKAFKPDDFKLLETHWKSLEKDEDSTPEQDERYGYASMFTDGVWCHRRTSDNWSLCSNPARMNTILKCHIKSLPTRPVLSAKNSKR